MPIGFGGVEFLANAPFATITRKRRPIRWHVEISIPAAPGPGPIFFQDTFDSLEEAVIAINDCYFGERIDFNAPSLKQWYPVGEKRI